MNWLKELTTTSDNTTPCWARIVGLMGVAQGLALSATDVIINHSHFDFQAYGIGLGGLITGVGAAIGMKRKDEPDA
jgi:hypothetical protein